MSTNEKLNRETEFIIDTVSRMASESINQGFVPVIIIGIKPRNDGTLKGYCVSPLENEVVQGILADLSKQFDDSSTTGDN
jgi:hypothetical protein